MKKGYFGEFGGCFVPELLMPPLQELEEAMRDIMPSPTFKEELDDLLRNFAGRETPLTYCSTLSKRLGFSLWLKREDLLHTGAHKVNNTLGQALLAKHMGKTALVAETGAGQHGVATAAAAARLGLECIVFMGAEDVERQSSNVRRMKLLGAEVRPVQSGTRTLKDAINEALRYWIAAQETTHYCFGTAAVRTPSPRWFGIFRASSGAKPVPRCWRKPGVFPMRSLRPWAAAPMPSACSIPSWMTHPYASSALRRPVPASRDATIPRRSTSARRASCTDR